MAKTLVTAVVRLWGKLVGAVAELDDGTVVFEYDPAFRRSGLEISPIKLPLSLAGPVSFPELSRVEAFAGLPGVLADGLPDRFGNAIIRKYFSDNGHPERALSPVQKLLYIGHRAMGALEFQPAIRLGTTPAEQEPIEISRLVKQARQLIEGRVDVAVPEIMRIGASAGGARAKALILWNRKTNQVRSGFARPRSGDEHWLIKFDGVGELEAPDPNPQPYNRIECAYSHMARAAGIEIQETRLLEERRLGHFLVRRFDRVGATRLHLHSLGGMQHVDYNQPGTFSYEQYLRTVLDLNLGYPALEEVFRRMVFNLAAVNQDDHVKNFAFLMDESGKWRLAPAYDVTYASGHGYSRNHQMTLAGKITGFTREDLLATGGRFGIKHDGADIIRQVCDALGNWRHFAAEAKVPAERVDFIEQQFRRFR
jgi:serine/threonine-protein kinase HipA